ncbi:glucose-1-phosphate adenylyltransferase subunit GlgD [Pseudoflavonifractor sp. MSJ-37]|uniref:glucose-1-phosphate adenylyltransferase subunit GlgD n=1 Tax=Pseudoflavonifractor sp. MSJ-37 TaxID=2841531 RepID=UPI001C0F502D|nr:glucose-1-phosphate adenylyltransferase subunit GlgD [Pseudoflavonifractor sp. MSJ-37]MBU5434989.1 glucose-1-phosphate adenylyltransferase subunit GlgD [Pseudoflavonifractor sp. MSJ-37]
MINKLHGIIFAYRSNPNLRELTQHRNTCSIPYGGRYRVVDFMLSNFVNAGISDVGLIVHANYQSLLDHVGSGKDWDLSRKHGGLRILPPFGYANKRGDGNNYHGRMDALAGVYSYIKRIRQEYVILAGGDLAVNLPIAEIFQSHIDSGADLTAVCTSKLNGDPRSCDYFTMGPDGFASDVAVRPIAPVGMESLEVYILSKEFLLSLVDYCVAHNISSFGEGVLLNIIGRKKINIYPFDGYAARLQSVPGYFARSMELLDPEVRRELFVPERPIKTKDQSNPSTYYGPDARSADSLVADGCIIEGEVEDCILFRGVKVEKGARVSHCVLMQGSVIRSDAVLKYVITDKNVTVSPGRMLMGHSSYPLAIAKNETV